ncbi:MAG TPA: methyltransferase domain-containing protein [Fimbriimonadaceae bacterium]|nr:methyltransferase domain-containing protein [Fimbriimonadaceae bacterium]
MRTSDWDPKLYDTAASFVTNYGGALVDILDPKPGERILDIGCGTGHLTHEIRQRGAKVVGLDSSPNMIQEARANYPDLEFVQASASSFTFKEPFDAVFSNAALHWVQDAESAVSCMSHALRPGGRFVVETGGKGNIDQLITALFKALEKFDCYDATHNWFFPSIGEYTSMLERHRLEPTAVWLFDRPTKLEGDNAIVDWFKIFGDAIQAKVDDDCFQEAVEMTQKSLEPKLRRDGVWYADYRRLRVVARRLG